MRFEFEWSDERHSWVCFEVTSKAVMEFRDKEDAEEWLDQQEQQEALCAESTPSLFQPATEKSEFAPRS